MIIEVKEIKSSTKMKQFLYHDESEMLFVYFENTGIYRFSEVPRHIITAWLDSDSFGSFFAKNIKSNYKSEKVLNVA